MNNFYIHNASYTIMDVWPNAGCHCVESAFRSLYLSLGLSVSSFWHDAGNAVGLLVLECFIYLVYAQQKKTSFQIVNGIISHKWIRILCSVALRFANLSDAIDWNPTNHTGEEKKKPHHTHELSGRLVQWEMFSLFDRIM